MLFTSMNYEKVWFIDTFLLGALKFMSIIIMLFSDDTLWGYTTNMGFKNQSSVKCSKFIQCQKHLLIQGSVA